ncbi:D-xylose transport system ATP-binding protein [Homoserinimonas aerilata]|uniref:D-xylose transport system ATP-binding protein n=1 Tax=Homoserinimonas aerilata TaxID=1162970 RepID=A0A542YLN0_9MICO|nr:ATP-binding cassette domain-containing protein [Homoserinimonas aerilata]TQL48854.1 D-xylose transport system ATP-binding protein [Homoserinimonas aerilata]
MSISTESLHAAAPQQHDRLLEVNNLELRFGNVVALDGVTMHANRNEITAIIGDNGAGKSSLTKCILGVYKGNGGDIRFNGEKVEMASPHAAKNLGIEAVFQDLALFDDLTLWQNMFIGRELTRGIAPFSILRRKEMVERSDELVRKLTVNVPDARRTVRSMSGGQRQAVAIARAVAWGSELVIMDEPTAALGVRERTEVEDTIIGLRDEGRSFLLISHSFDQVMRVADAVWVMRQGRAVAHRRISETSGEELVALVTGAKAE